MSRRGTHPQHGERLSPGATPLAPGPTYDPPRQRQPSQPAPQQQPTLQDVLSAMAQSRSDTITRLDDMSKVQQLQTHQIRALDERTTQLQHAIGADCATTEALAARISQLEQANSRPGSSVPSSQTSGSHRGRGPPTDPYASDRTILRGWTSSTVSLQAMQAALTPVTGRANVPTRDIELHGSQMGRAFTMRLRPGARGNAEDAINSIMAARRLPDGSWAKVDIQTPYGAALPVYIERDKSYAQRKTAFHLTCVVRTLRAAFATKTFEVARSSGIVTHDWREVAQVRYNPDNNTAAGEWSDSVSADLGGNSDGIRDAYKTMLASTTRASSVGSRG